MLLFRVPLQERAMIVAVWQCVKDSFWETYSSKFEMSKHLPYVLLGMLHTDLGMAKACARDARGEWNHCKDKNKIHRVAHRCS